MTGATMKEAFVFDGARLTRFAGPVVETLTPTAALVAGLAHRSEPDFLASLWVSMSVVDDLVIDRAVSVRSLH